MSLRLYMDEHVRMEIVRGLRRRGIDVVTAQEDGRATASDSELLARASAIGRVLFTQDADLIAEAVKRQRAGIGFTGVIYAHQLGPPIGQCIDDLELIANVCEPAEMAGVLLYLPLR